MKKAILLFVVVSLIPFFGGAQHIENLDYISPFHEELSAIKKNKQWGFINTKGELVVDFRNDLVTTKFKDGNYPIFKDGRCLIEEEKEGIFYYGYIDTTGKTAIAPQFLNATNFKNNSAIALELGKQIGKNEVLDKTLVYHKYFEVTINTNGEVTNYINPKGIHIALDKRFLEKRPKITSKRISDNLVATKNTDGKWKLTKIK